MSWLRSALNKAAEVGGKSLPPAILRTGRNLAGSVYQTTGHALAGGAKIVQDRLSGRRYNDFRQAVRKLEEVARTARGRERYEALLRWLGALKDIQRESERLAANAEARVSGGEEGNAAEEGALPPPSRASLVLFYDSDANQEPLTFRDVFLRSHALENIVTSMIEDAPDEEEVSLVLDMFGLCLAGGPELHRAIMSGIQDLAKANSNYMEKVMIERQELLQMARDCITGLKLSSEVERLDDEINRFQQMIDERLATPAKEEEVPEDGDTAAGKRLSVAEQRGRTSEEVYQLRKRMHECVLKKAAIWKVGDTEESHSSKVQRLKDLTTKLSADIQTMKKKVADSKQQKQDSLSYRTTKAQEVMEAEKVIAQEVQVLEKKREQLEAELKEVKAQIAAATAKHIHIQEEKEQFDVASSNIVAHLSIQEEQLNHKVGAHTIEISVVATWQSFLEDTWLLRSNCIAEKEDKIKSAVKASASTFLETSETYAQACKEEIGTLLPSLKSLAEEISALKDDKPEGGEGVEEPSVERQKLEEKYVEVEAEVKRILAMAEATASEMEALEADSATYDTKKVVSIKELFAAAASQRSEFEKMERPRLKREEVRRSITSENLFRRKSMELREELKMAVGGAAGTLSAALAKLDSPHGQAKSGEPEDASKEGKAVDESSKSSRQASLSDKAADPPDDAAPKAEKEGVGGNGGEGWDVEDEDEKEEKAAALERALSSSNGDGEEEDGDDVPAVGFFEGSIDGELTPYSTVGDRRVSRSARRLHDIR